jgi:hypothetical protein
MDLCTCVIEEGGDEEGEGSEEPSLLSYTLRYVSLTELVNVWQVGHTIDSGIGLSIKIDKLRVFINKTLSVLSECVSMRVYQ